MKPAAVFYCFVPWLVYGVNLLLDRIEGTSVAGNFPLMWLIISPGVVGLGIFVSHTEGRRGIK